MEGFLRTAPFTILFLPLFGMIVIALVGPRVHRIGAAVIGNLSILGAFVLTAVLAWTVWQLPPDAQVLTVKYPPAWAAHPAVLGSHSAADHFVRAAHRFARPVVDAHHHGRRFSHSSVFGRLHGRAQRAIAPSLPT